MLKEVIKDSRIDEAVTEIISYVEILSDYMSFHSSIPQMLHASLLVDKMQDKLDVVKTLIYDYSNK